MTRPPAPWQGHQLVYMQLYLLSPPPPLADIENDAPAMLCMRQDGAWAQLYICQGGGADIIAYILFRDARGLSYICQGGADIMAYMTFREARGLSYICQGGGGQICSIYAISRST